MGLFDFMAFGRKSERHRPIGCDLRYSSGGQKFCFLVEGEVEGEDGGKRLRGKDLKPPLWAARGAPEQHDAPWVTSWPFLQRVPGSPRAQEARVCSGVPRAVCMQSGCIDCREFKNE